MAATCKACGVPLIWIETPKHKWIPCDEGLKEYQADENGHDILIGQNGETIRCRLSFKGKATGTARTPHWATCTEPDKFRKGGIT